MILRRFSRKLWVPMNGEFQSWRMLRPVNSIGASVKHFSFPAPLSQQLVSLTHFSIPTEILGKLSDYEKLNQLMNEKIVWWKKNPRWVWYLGWSVLSIREKEINNYVMWIEFGGIEGCLSLLVFSSFTFSMGWESSGFKCPLDAKLFVCSSHLSRKDARREVCKQIGKKISLAMRYLISLFHLGLLFSIFLAQILLVLEFSGWCFISFPGIRSQWSFYTFS